MRGAVLHAPGDVQFDERDYPKIIDPTDAIIRMSATCVCGSDLCDYRGINPAAGGPTPMGHEYCGIVEEVGADGTCPHCLAGWQTSCQRGEFVGANGAQADALRGGPAPVRHFLRHGHGRAARHQNVAPTVGHCRGVRR
ncbi:MAG: hypothetical protein QOJ11_1779 [Frankiales bacterium]|jgi:threonine dehydrogenase-like Zn-dependent dehydrogenase|nr:hypothetical protein [Frankiales bacterium]